MKTHSWETSFEDGGNKMIHIFSDRLQVVYYRDIELLGILKDGEIMDSFYPGADFSIGEYMDYLLKVEKEAERLAVINYDL